MTRLLRHLTLIDWSGWLTRPWWDVEAGAPTAEDERIGALWAAAFGPPTSTTEGPFTHTFTPDPDKWELVPNPKSPLRWLRR